MIEILETKDYHMLAELNEEIQTFHHKTYPSIFKPYNKEAVTLFFKNSLDDKNVVAYVAKENGKALGYVLLFIVNFAENPFQYSRNYILLDQILVLKNHQSKGIGKQLLDATFSFAKSNKITRIELNHWTANDVARKFFSKSGFEYYNEKMRKEIE